MPASVDPALDSVRDPALARYGAVAGENRPERLLRRACLAIPLLMVVIGAAIAALQRYLARADVPMPNNLGNLHGIGHLALSDSWGPMLAVRDWLARHPGGDAYEYFFFGLGTKFQYPLSSLIPIHWLPLDGAAAFHVLNLFSLAAWIAVAVGMVLLDLRLARLLRLPLASGDMLSRLWLAAAATIATFCFFPLIRAVYIGQIQTFLDALFVFACYFLASGRSASAGLLIGLSALVKPQMVLFLLWGALRRDRPFVVAMAACVAVGYAVSAWLYGWAWPFAYLHVLEYIGQHGEGLYENHSVNGLVNHMLGNGPNLVWDGQHFAPYNATVHRLTLLSTVALVVGGLWGARTAMTRLSATASLMVAGLCFTAASPVAWDHHYGVMLPLFGLLFLSLLANPRSGAERWSLLCGTFVMAANALSPVNLLAGTPLSFLQSYVFFAALGVLALVFLCRRDLGWASRA
ncbi:hypothetical protein AA13595_2859 [Gluconacetobacter johannae DSM 13595]|uniref:DUF2029 domain-containing protein n=1 Tax=Gluconacetobacter johannae TaxID=112140 RepID=A0A7W4JAJ1_9PROT|nr:glycosyltransferase family 87 protein [Gluconacetobacter johannae]MBB2177497.1 DUF2029 domain-containing protein [Gluconacetobacter johannae]GBQ90297.1 hypothetical protein AA13595_2859 [Gluconacetobacter johannae DSM 13595]